MACNSQLDALWTSPFAVDLADFVIQDMERLTRRVMIGAWPEWQKDPEPVATVVEAPVTRTGLSIRPTARRGSNAVPAASAHSGKACEPTPPQQARGPPWFGHWHADCAQIFQSQPQIHGCVGHIPVTQSVANGFCGDLAPQQTPHLLLRHGPRQPLAQIHPRRVDLFVQPMRHGPLRKLKPLQRPQRRRHLQEAETVVCARALADKAFDRLPPQRSQRGAIPIEPDELQKHSTLLNAQH